MKIAKKREEQMNWDKVDEALSSAAAPTTATVESKHGTKKYVFPGASLLVGQGGQVIHESVVGCRSLFPEVTPNRQDMVYDISSLTKAIAGTTLVMQLVDRGLLDVDKRLTRIFQTFGTYGKESMTVRHLLAHCSGYPATAPFYRHIIKQDMSGQAGIMTSRGAVESIYNEIFRARLDNLPGRVTQYSDIGFILLGNAIEVISGGKYLDRLAHEGIFKPLHMHSTGYIDLSKTRRRGVEPVTEIIAPTVDCPWRGRVLCGEVHDDNAWAMGGVSAHAGLFSTARDIHIFATEMINCYHGRGKLVSKDVVREFWKIDNTVKGSTWALGWDTPTPDKSSSGKYFSPSSVGHLGFTGCSMWIDPEREIDVILLSNRIHPSIENERIKEFRPLIHDIIMDTLGYS
jgi:serine-type D-Ala-D-Ala carboxypeptidase